MNIGKKILGSGAEGKKNSSVVKKMVVGLLVTVLVVAISIAISGVSEAEPTGTGDDIILGVYVYDEDGPVEDLGVDLYNNTEDLVDSNLTDSDGEAWFHVTDSNYTSSLDNGTIEVEDPDDETKTHELDLSVSEPGENESTVETFTVDLSIDYEEEAESYMDENPYIVVGGGFILLMIIGVVLLTATDNQPW